MRYTFALFIISQWMLPKLIFSSKTQPAPPPPATAPAGLSRKEAYGIKQSKEFKSLRFEKLERAVQNKLLERLQSRS